MKHRIKKKKWKQKLNCYTNKKQRDKNKALCKRFPFLIPGNIFTDKIIWMRKPYDWTLAEAFPSGWWKAFGIQLCEELREELLKYNYLKDYRITDIKEKYGGLRIYGNGTPKECDVSHIIDDYSVLSENICMDCGKVDIPMLEIGIWLQPLCKDCYYKMLKHRLKYTHEDIDEQAKYEDCICRGDSGVMETERKYTLYVPEQEPETIIRDISDKANKIRARWRAGHADN